jgi:DNA-binding NarL/FixJ family response regulator
MNSTPDSAATIFVSSSNRLLRNSLVDLVHGMPETRILASAARLADAEHVEEAIDVLILASPDAEEQIRDWVDIDSGPELHGMLLLGGGEAMFELLRNADISAWGLLDAEADFAEIEAAVLAIINGLIVLSPEAERAIQRTPRPVSGLPVDSLIEPLTPREIEVLELLAAGRSNRQIAAVLSISTHTVKFHISSIYGKLNAANRAEAVKLGVQQGLLIV